MDALGEESLVLRARYDEEPSHSDQVARLALQLYDGLETWHKLGARSRELLHSAALLHDIGWSQTPEGKAHHKASARLIREHAWQNPTKDEVELIAVIARYHRKTPPQPDHEEFYSLKAPAQRSVMILAGILRIADALDRTHTSKIERIEVNVAKDAVNVRVQPIGTWNEERVMFETKRDMLQMAVGRPVECGPV